MGGKLRRLMPLLAGVVTVAALAMVAFVIVLWVGRGRTPEGGGTDPGETGLADEEQTPSFDIAQSVEVCGTTSLNNRSGPGSQYMILRQLPEGTSLRIRARTGGWYRVAGDAGVGWSSGRYLCSPGPAAPSDLSGEAVLSVSASFVGFSYWWGGAALKPGSNEFGRCLSTDDHRGPYGADCSGFVAKVWGLPEALPLESNKHPFSTASFHEDGRDWTRVPRESARAGDAMVYRQDGRGHIVVLEHFDAWRSAWTYEARGCAYGIVHNLRTLSPAYRAIRRRGL